MTVIGSVCSGYDGLAQGIALAFGGASLAYVADNDPGAELILAHRYPGTPNLGDIRTARWEDLPPADVFCAGFPCQPASEAGKRGGMTDERWLWPSIADGIGRLGARPRMLVLENVPGLLTLDHGRAMAQVVYSLAALGYVGRYGVYSASGWAGACHLRKRLFIVAADAAGARCGGAEIPGADRRVQGAAAAEEPGKERAGVREPERGDGQHPGPLMLLPTPTSHVSGRTGEQHMAMRASIGRKTPSQLEAAVQLLPTPSAGNFNDGESLESWEARRQRNLAKGINGNGQGTPLAIAAQWIAVEWGEYEPAVRRWEAITEMPAPCPVEPGKNGNRRLAPPFPEWMMGLPPGWVTDVPGLTRVQMLRAIGNGVVPQQAAAAIGHLLAGMRQQALPVAARIGSWPGPRRRRAPRPPAWQDAPVRGVPFPFGDLGGQVLRREGEGPALLVPRGRVGCGDGLAVEVAFGAPPGPAGVGGPDVARVEPEPGVGVRGEQVLDGAEAGGDAVAAVVAAGRRSPLGPHGAAEGCVSGLRSGIRPPVPGHAITVAVMDDSPRRQPNGHYAVDWIGNPYQPAGNFDFAAHDRWVQQGHCPVVSYSKAWCSNNPHPSSVPHGSPVAPGPDGRHWQMWDR